MMLQIQFNIILFKMIESQVALLQTESLSK